MSTIALLGKLILVCYVPIVTLSSHFYLMADKIFSTFETKRVEIEIKND